MSSPPHKEPTSSPPRREITSSPLREPNPSSPLREPITSSPPQPPYQSPQPSPSDSSASSDYELSPPSSPPPTKRSRYEFAKVEVPFNPSHWPPPESVPVQGSEQDPEVDSSISDDENLFISSTVQQEESAVLSDSGSTSDSSHSEAEQETDSSVAVESVSDYGSDSEDSETGADPCFGGLKVYEGCNLTVDQAVCLVMDLFLTQKLSKTSLQYVLKVICKFLPDDHHMPQSLFSLFKYVHESCAPVSFKVHFYCETCLFYIGEEEKKCPLCDSNCKKFYQLSIEEQIKNLFEIHNLSQIIDRYSEQRSSRQSDGKYFDICDGSEYQRVQVAGKYNLTLLGHTDGVCISNSSNVSLWPLEYAICEVPPELRYKFVLIAGVYVDSTKPNLHSYFEPFVSELQMLFEEGVTWVNPITKT